MLGAAVVIAGCGASSTTDGPIVVGGRTPHHAAQPNRPGGDHVSLGVRSIPGFGRFLVADGWTLYVYPPDRHRRVTCTARDRCKTAWPPLFVSAGHSATAEAGVNQRLIGTDMGDGGRVVTYHGWPLYYYIGDRAPDVVNGQGQGRDWYVIAPGGRPLKKQLPSISS